MLHDTQRRNERRDPSHGRRAARYAKSLRGVWFDLSDKEMELLTEALKYHSDGYTEADITVQVCWDADRLDLGRVGIKPAPHRLCTASAKSVDVLEAAYERSLENENTCWKKKRRRSVKRCRGSPISSASMS